MMHYNVDPELARVIERAADSGEPVSIAIGERVYSLQVTSETGDSPDDIWVDYDADRILRALAEAKGIFTEDAAEELIKKVCERREEGPRTSTVTGSPAHLSSPSSRCRSDVP